MATQRKQTAGCRVALAAVTLAMLTSAAFAVTLDSVSPERQRVHDLIVLSGSDFGPFVPGISKVVFETPDGAVRVEAARAYRWNDDQIQVRVPVGDATGPTPQSELRVSVEGVGGVSGSLPFQLLVRGRAPLAFTERTRIVNDADVTGFLGNPEANKARTKDAHVGDANGDGWMDLIDNNSNNDSNNTHTILHLNQGGAGFNSMLWEPVEPGDNGDFVVTILPGGVYHENGITYDADLIDLNNDDLVDWVQASSSPSRVRIAMNDYLGVPGNFVEATNDWFGNQSPPGSPDDIDDADINNDGFTDIAAAYRFSDKVDIFFNDGGTTFSGKVQLDGTNFASYHDIFFLDANDDGWVDALGANESGDSQLFWNNADPPNNTFTPGPEFQGRGDVRRLRRPQRRRPR